MQMIHLVEMGSNVPRSVIYVPRIATEMLINKHLPPELLESRREARSYALTPSPLHCYGYRTPHTLHHPPTHINPLSPANESEPRALTAPGMARAGLRRREGHRADLLQHF